MSHQTSVALGFAWRAKNIGGVRRHLECIETYSRFPIAIYPSTQCHKLLDDAKDRNWYHDQLSDEVIDRHHLFHSHVDPKFIRIANHAQQRGKPWVHTYHTLYFKETPAEQLLPWQQEINEALINEARHADVCISVSPWLRQWLNDEHGIATIQIPNGVDVVACDNANAKRFRAQFALNSYVLFVGSLDPIKNPGAFLSAARQFPELSFVMIGANLTNEDISAVLKTDLPKNLFALGPMPHWQVLDAMAGCRALVMTSLREGFPTVLMEAMAMAKPCVAPNTYGCADVIGEMECGFLYKAGSDKDLVQKLTDALSIERLSRARQRVDELFCWPIVMRQIDDIYSDLLG